MPSPVAAKREDARTTRWADHRIKVRAEFVEASIRTIDTIGPQATLDDICAEMGVRKPKLYRFFDTKNDLYRAILEHWVEMLWDRLSGTLNIYEDSGEQIVRRLVSELADTIEEHPNVVQFLATGQYLSATGDTEHPLILARGAVDRASEVAEELLSDFISDHRQFELVVYSVFGMTASAADWWIRSEASGDGAMDRDLFINQVTRSIIGIITANLDEGVEIDVSQPLHLAVIDDEDDEDY
ncbi:MAG TPA: TetR family transcriptional regulator [Gordonia sp. (in: high G+C Gram-positive bacteria)]|uniref:TetR/AcrR family transcriptional regulator n=1 Tax=unclassified Gordonia (in: high G+C Gram-positive bacteria) TaxID=2657482 RepID=UPI000FC2BB66|nr:MULTISPECIES: TetR family transcriptional regulator [unclassified Gordonia (in: high G+C Gram-positive bacteria)]RUP40006.1 MAG: TetR/AcrR family transcriptional regulator [Gordonia sp. (in: high G+C Gram-positive bacteria)]HNP56575.1 TetR family transcriptional regulator [Gordonia sp. (in: high G+C Gram-positive bacteria)]HRC49664.1 TetR family transcriptional regulator [Gordonia sp. (in: high G+C Gram-positive bacteria)]